MASAPASQASGIEVHVGDRVLEAERDEAPSREDDREHLARHVVGGKAQPDREADQRVAEDAAEKRLAERQRDLGFGDAHAVSATAPSPSASVPDHAP